jgi:hypothetical protein
VQSSIQAFDDEVEYIADGRVKACVGQRRTAYYDHPLAYIEATFKRYGEWAIRVLPAWAWQPGRGFGFYTGDDRTGLLLTYELTDPVFSKDLPGRKPHRFCWDLREGRLITYFQGRRDSRIHVYRRYLVRDDSLEVVPWDGSYDDILDQMVVAPDYWSFGDQWALRLTTELTQSLMGYGSAKGEPEEWLLVPRGWPVSADGR